MASAQFSAFEIDVDGPKDLKPLFDFMGTFVRHKIGTQPPSAMTCSRNGHWLFGKVVMLRGETTDEVAESTTFITSKRTTPEGKEMGASSYFIINDKSRAGLYTRYRGGCSSTHLAKLFYSAQRIFQKDGSGSDEVGQILVHPLISKSSLRKILKEWKRVESFEYTFKTRSSKKSRSDVLDPYLTSDKHILRLSSTAQQEGDGIFSGLFSAIKSKIDSIKTDDEEAKIAIRGVDENENRRSIDPDELLDSFGSIELADLQADADKIKDDLALSQVVQLMVKKAKEHEAVFLREVER